MKTTYMLYAVHASGWVIVRISLRNKHWSSLSMKSLRNGQLVRCPNSPPLVHLSPQKLVQGDSWWMHYSGWSLCYLPVYLDFIVCAFEWSAMGRCAARASSPVHRSFILLLNVSWRHAKPWLASLTPIGLDSLLFSRSSWFLPDGIWKRAFSSKKD